MRCFGPQPSSEETQPGRPEVPVSTPITLMPCWETREHHRGWAGAAAGSSQSLQELLAVVSARLTWVLGTNLKFSRRAARALTQEQSLQPALSAFMYNDALRLFSFLVFFFCVCVVKFQAVDSQNQKNSNTNLEINAA